MAKSVAKIVGFVAALALVLGSLAGVLAYKNTTIGITRALHELPRDSVDVLILGSSHAYMGIDTGVLWDDYGIASFIYGGDGQPLWSTYYYLKEALQTQHPRLVVLEVFTASSESDYLDHAFTVTNTFGEMSLQNKLGNKLASVEADALADFVAEYPVYHGRYDELTREDFVPDKGEKGAGAWKGSLLKYARHAVPENPDVSDVTEAKTLTYKNGEYLTRIIDLLEREGIPLVMIAAPDLVSPEEQKAYNAVAELAEARGIPFVNYNLLRDEVGLDFTGEDTDLADEFGHLNSVGAGKLTRHLGTWLTERYDVPDRRGDARYASWQADADRNRLRAEDFALRETDELAAWLDRVCGSDRFTLVLHVGPAYSEAALTSLNETLAAAGAPFGAAPGGFTAIVQDGQLVYASAGEPSWVGSVWGGVLAVDAAGVWFDYEEYPFADDAVWAFLYDDATGELVETVAWPEGYDAKQASGPQESE